jgi:hypothetical protein
MSPNVLRLIDELSQRVEKLERQRSKRGVAPSKAKAAAYIGRSDEWLRLREKDGTGPERTPNGDYFYDALDQFLLASRETGLPPPEPRADRANLAEPPQSEVAPSLPTGRLGSVRARATRGQAAAE